MMMFGSFRDCARALRRTENSWAPPPI